MLVSLKEIIGMAEKAILQFLHSMYTIQKL